MHASSRPSSTAFAGDVRPDRKPVGTRERQGACGLSEPRSLFDDCLRAYEDIEARAGEAGIDRLDGLYVRAQQLDFGAQQRLNYVSLIRAGGAVTAELKIEQPAIAGSDNRL